MAGSSAATSARTFAPGTARPRAGGWSEFEARPGMERSRPDRMVDDDDAEWKARLKGTALSRSKRAGLLRNAALVLGSRR